MWVPSLRRVLVRTAMVEAQVSARVIPAAQILCLRIFFEYAEAKPMFPDTLEWAEPSEARILLSFLVRECESRHTVIDRYHVPLRHFDPEGDTTEALVP